MVINITKMMIDAVMLPSRSLSEDSFLETKTATQ